MHKSAFSFEGLTKNTLEKAKELNLDSVFVGKANLNTESIQTAKAELPSLKIFVELSCFNGFDLLEKFPDAKPMEATGMKIDAERSAGVCPTHPGVRDEIVKRIKETLAFDIDGIWLDFIRYPSKWELSEPYILDTCYCDRCLKMFEEYIGEPIAGVGGEGSDLENTALHIDGSYYHEWLEFKAEQIVSIIRKAKELIGESGRDVKLGAFVIPWEDKEHGAAIKRVVAQDFGKFAQYVDYFSPMFYHKMCGKPVEWIKEKVEYFWHVGVPFLPLIQTEPRPKALGAEEFKLALEYASAKPSMGVGAFFLEDLVKQKELFEIVRNVFHAEV